MIIDCLARFCESCFRERFAVTMRTLKTKRGGEKKKQETKQKIGISFNTHFKTAVFKDLLYFSDDHRNGECCRLPINGRKKQWKISV